VFGRFMALTGSLALAAGLAVGPPAQAQSPEDPRTTSGLSDPIYTEHVQEEFRVQTRHGTLFGFVDRPVVPEGVKVPVILTYSPYNVIGCPSNVGCDVHDDFYVPRGYARAVFDVVGLIVALD